MGFLERFRPQPRWKHPDGAVRLAAVQELEDTDQETLAALAGGDPDPEVRRAAAGRLADPDTLATIARADADQGVRDAAIRILLVLALGRRAEGEPAVRAVALRALAGLDAQRELAAVATSGEPDSARQAVAHLRDQKALGSVARKAEDAAVRFEAIARITEPAELARVALRSEHKESALRALEQITDPERLEEIANGARSKAAARRARAMLQQTAAREDRRRRRVEICELTERLVTGDDPAELERRLSAVAADWQAVAGDQEDAAALEDEDLGARLSAATDAVRARGAALVAERAERRRREEAGALEIAARRTLWERVETIDGESAPEALAAIRAEWEALPPFTEAGEVEREALRRRFDDACRACEARHEGWRAARARRADLERLCEALEAAVERPDLADATAGAAAVRTEWTQLAGEGPIDEDLTGRLAAAAERLRGRGEAAREQEAQQRQANRTRLHELCDRLERLPAAGDVRLKDVERALREIRHAIDAPPPLPSARDEDEVVARLRRIQTALYPRARELRELEEWQQWANVSAQEDLCGRVEALLQESDPEVAARALREILARWAQVASVPPDHAERLRERFKVAHDQVRARCDEHFARLAEERAANLARKQALCERAEALADSSDWIRTAEEIKRLQAEWKAIGPIPRRQARALWNRFRTACDRFFTRRKEDLSRRKHEWARNLARKEALCERAEALAESTDWDVAAAEIKRLQADWRAIGPVKKKRSELVWQRFRAACDRFFERYRHRDQIELEGRLAGLDALCRELEALLPAGTAPLAAPEGAGAETPAVPPPEPVAAPEAMVERVQEIRTRWNQSGVPPAPRGPAAPLATRFRAGIDRLVSAYPDAFRGTDLDPARNLDAMERLCTQVEGVLADLAKEVDASPAEILARKWRDALAANTMGARVDEEARWRAAGDEVRRAQAAWIRIGPAPLSLAAPLAERFRTACDRFFDLQRRRGGRSQPRQPRAAPPAQRQPAKAGQD